MWRYNESRSEKDIFKGGSTPGIHRRTIYAYIRYLEKAAGFPEDT